MPKVVLAYTGGLATSLCIHWLRMKKGLDVVTFTANVGQPVNLEPLGERAIELGAEAAHIGDLRERFVRDFAFHALRAGAVYDSGYYLGKALTRPLIVQEIARIAEDDHCDYFAHGCSGRGNDRVRFEAAIAAIAPHVKVIAPLEEWGVTTREEQRRLAGRLNLEVALAEDALAPAVDQNLWGIGRVQDAALVEPGRPIPEEIYRITVDPERAPDQAEETTIRFLSGVPIGLCGESLRPVEIMERLNQLGGKHGVGRRDVVEDRISGIKTREVYEAPAATVLYEAHRQLERLVLPKDVLQFKVALARKYAELVYDGLWFSDLREGLEAFFDRTQECVTGDVRVRLYKGRAVVRAIESPYSLYDKGLARSAIEGTEGEWKRGIHEALSYAQKARSAEAVPRAPPTGRDDGREAMDEP